MKFGKLILLVIVLSFWNIAASAQCDYKITVSSKANNNKGEISVKIANSGSYKCVLYVYEGGEKLTKDEISGNSTSVSFKELQTNRYYSVAFYFKKQDELLCSSWVSDLIQIKE